MKIDNLYPATSRNTRLKVSRLINSTVEVTMKKVSLIISSVCVISLAMFYYGRFGAQAHSQIDAVHPAISGRFAHSDPTVSTLSPHGLAEQDWSGLDYCPHLDDGREIAAGDSGDAGFSFVDAQDH